MATSSGNSVPSPAPPKWFDVLPTPKSSPERISVQALHDMMRQGKQAGVDFVVVDVRRADVEDPLSCLHPGAINLPAQTFYHTLPVIARILKGIPLVIFHCTSSNGRGPRCAGWYQDHLDGIGGSAETRAMILDGGIKAWAAAYPDEVVQVQ